MDEIISKNKTCFGIADGTNIKNSKIESGKTEMEKAIDELKAMHEANKKGYIFNDDGTVSKVDQIN